MKVTIEFEVSEQFVEEVCDRYGYEADEVKEMLKGLDKMFKKDYSVILQEELNLFDC